MRPSRYATTVSEGSGQIATIWTPTVSRGFCRAYVDLLGSPDRVFIERTLALLAQAERPKGHATCPCGSGRRLRDCHGALISRLRDRIARADAAYDLWFLREKDGGARGRAGE